jgi:hypothetical protein
MVTSRTSQCLVVLIALVCLGALSLSLWYGPEDSGSKGKPPTASSTEAQTGHHGPSMRLPACRILNAGEGTVGQVLEIAFPIENAGNLPLEVDVGRGSACAFVRPERAVIAPGEAVSVKVGVRLRQEGKIEQMLLLVQSNDPKQPHAELLVMAKCPAWLQLQPHTIDLGRQVAGASREVVVEVSDGRNSPLNSTEDIELQTSSAVVRADWVAPARLRITIGPIPKGEQRVEVTLRSKSTGKALHFPVNFEGVGRISVAPRELFLDSQRREGIIVIYSNTGPVPEIDVEGVPPWLQVVPHREKSERRLRYVVQIKDAGAAEATSATIRLRVRGAEEEEIVTVRFRP